VSESIVWNVFRKDIGRKLTALGLAVGVWFWLANNLVGERRFLLEIRVVETRREAEDAQVGVPALYVVKPEQFILLEGDSVQASVVVRGLKTDLELLELSAVFEVPLDAIPDQNSTPDLQASNEGEGIWTLLLNNPAQFRAIGATLDELELEVIPPVIDLLLARKARAVVELGPENVQLHGEPQSGYEVGLSMVVPNQVGLIGPQRNINAIVADPTLLKFETINLDGKSFTVHQYVGLDRDIVDRPVQLDRTEVVRVTVPIYEKDSLLELYTVPVRYVNEEGLERRGMELVDADQELDLLVTGPKVVLDRYSEEQMREMIRLEFNWKDAKHRVANIEVKVLMDDKLPDSIQIFDIDGGAPEIMYTLRNVAPSVSTNGAADSP
jgi:hypothetical protein